MYFRTYAKFEGQKNFKPLDLSTGTQVTNLIHATLIPSENVPKLLEALKQNTEGVKLEIRAVEGSKIIKVN